MANSELALFEEWITERYDNPEFVKMVVSEIKQRKVKTWAEYLEALEFCKGQLMKGDLGPNDIEFDSE